MIGRKRGLVQGHYLRDIPLRRALFCQPITLNCTGEVGFPDAACRPGDAIHCHRPGCVLEEGLPAVRISSDRRAKFGNTDRGSNPVASVRVGLYQRRGARGCSFRRRARISHKLFWDQYLPWRSIRSMHFPNMTAPGLEISSARHMNSFLRCGSSPALALRRP